MDKQDKTHYKCQTTENSYIDNIFVVFSNSFLITKIRQYILDNNIELPIVLDVGCYNGRLMQYLIQNRIFVNYIGLDIRNDYLESSQVKNRKDVKLLCEDISKQTSIENETIDIITSTEVFEHMSEEDAKKIIY
jgi:2-polyprenyl-3-methyl-5-hydroxy-6-metoxy-1,4-benzoquinol methylase